MPRLSSDTLWTDSLSKTSIPSGEYGAPIQTKFKHFTHRSSQSILGDNTFNVISNFQITITPQRTANKLLIGVQWCGEVDDLWQKAFSVGRSGTVYTAYPDFPNPYQSDIQNGTAPGLDTYASTAENNATTPASCTFWAFDTAVSTSSSVTYQLIVRSNLNETFYTNRTQTDSDLITHERFQSWMCVMEFSGG